MRADDVADDVADGAGDAHRKDHQPAAQIGEDLRKCKDEDKTISEGTKKDYKSALDNLEKFCSQGNTVNSFNEFTKK